MKFKLFIIIGCILILGAKKVEIPYDTVLMIKAGQAYKYKTIATGKPNLDVIEECRGHCKWMVTHRMSHEGFSGRNARLAAKYPGHNFREIVATHSGYTNDPEEAALQIFKQWRGSSGHNKFLKKSSRIYGFSIAHIGSRWVAIGLMSN